MYWSSPFVSPVGLQIFGSTGGAPQYNIWILYVPNSTSQIPTSQVNLNMQCVILASCLVGRASYTGAPMAKRAECIVCMYGMYCMYCTYCMYVMFCMFGIPVPVRWYASPTMCIFTQCPYVRHPQELVVNAPMYTILRN